MRWAAIATSRHPSATSSAASVGNDSSGCEPVPFDINLTKSTICLTMSQTRAAMAAISTVDFDARVGAVRRFNRLYTRRIGVLEDGFLGSHYSLTQARV